MQQNTHHPGPADSPVAPTPITRVISPVAGLAAALALLIPSLAPAAQPEADDKSGNQAQVRLISATGTAAPGSTFDLGVHFTIDKDWHIYWPGQNDSGLPPAVSLKLPKGWTAGEILWPAPRRYVYDGEYVDHIYEQAVTLIIPISVPKDGPTASPATDPSASSTSGRPRDGTHTIEAEVSWMVCHKVCAMGSASTDIKITVVPPSPLSPPTPPAEVTESAKLILAARDRLPKPLASAKGITATLNGANLVIKADEPCDLIFMPHASAVLVDEVLKTCATPSAPPSTPAAAPPATPPTLTIPLKKPTPGIKTISGVLQVTRPKPTRADEGKPSSPATTTPTPGTKSSPASRTTPPPSEYFWVELPLATDASPLPALGAPK